MNRNKFVILLFFITMSFLASCSSDENPTEPSEGENNQGATNMSGQPMPAVAGDAAGILATINYEFQTIPGMPAAAITMGFAQFGSGVDGGNVSVNNNSLGKNTQSGVTFYATPSPGNPTASLSGVNFDGSNHSWQISGAGSVPQLGGSVKSPSQFNLTAPSNNTDVNKSSGITVNWSNSSSGSQVLIVLVPIDDSGDYFAIEGLNDNGNYTIQASDISGFSGDAMLQVVKYNYKSVSAGGETFYLISEIVKSIIIKIN